MKSFYYIDKRGATELPTKKEIVEAKIKGWNYIVFLDSNICFDLIQIVDKKDIPDHKMLPIIEFLIYQESNPFDIGGALGVYELALGRFDFSSNSIKKYNDFGDKLNFFYTLSIEQIISKNFEFNSSNKTEHIKENKYSREIFNRSYISILKIREIAKRNGLRRNTALKNVTELLDWLHSVLNIAMSIEIQLAIYLFGGENDFKSMIQYDGNKPETILRKLKSTAWDITHFRNSIISIEAVREELNNKDIPIFATKDQALFKLLKNLETESITQTPTNPVKPRYFISYEAQFFRNNNKLNELLSAFFIKRDKNSESPRAPMDSLQMKREIQQLENIHLSNFSKKG